MVLGNYIVSLWQDQAGSRFLCSGVHLESSHILTVAHVIEDLQSDNRIFVRLLPRREGGQPASLIAREPRLDAAIFKLDEPIDRVRLPLPGNVKSDQGKRGCIHAIDPDTHHVVSLPRHVTIGCYDGRPVCEYVFSPETAHGYSGGLLALGELPLGLLNCRIQNEPIARAIALAELRPWIAYVIDTSRGPDEPAGPDYDALVELLGVRAMQLLANPGTADLRRLGRFPSRAAELVGRPRPDCFETLVVDLDQATRVCLDHWRASNQVIPGGFKTDCQSLLGELLKGAVDRRDRTPAELAELAAATPDRMFVACQRTGTAATVYCALTDIPLRLTEPKRDDLDIGGGSVIDLTDLAMGVGPDADGDVFKAVWLAVRRTSAPTNFADPAGRGAHVKILRDWLEMVQAQYQQDPRFLVARGPREWLAESGLARVGDALRIGLVIHSADRDYAYLAVSENRLINHVCYYLQLLDSI